MTNTLNALSSGLADLVEATSPSLFTVLGHRVNATATAWAADGLLVTANHNLPRGEQPVIRLHDGSERAARVLGRDPATDLALLQLPGVELTLPTWSSKAPRVGELAVALGRAGRTPRATLGLVSQVNGPWRTQWGASVDRWIEVDGGLPRGFSGGPLVGANGELLGVNTRSLVRGGTTLPTDTLHRVLKALLDGGQVSRGSLGVTVDKQLTVMDLKSGGPAAQAGVQAGDRITGLAGTPVSDSAQLFEVLDGLGDQQVPLAVVRGEESLSLSVQLTSRATPRARRRRGCR